MRLFPEVRTEGGAIDFDRLRLLLGDRVDEGKERYGIGWPGKAECLLTVQKPSLGTLLPYPDESVNFETAENLIIEGDNLEVLKLLQKSYHNKVKVIYIDPPYNIGNDFIYPDNFAESLQTYLQYTGQVDAEGRKFSTNTEADGRFHSKWLSVMYVRLFVARNLLTDDGIMFISIDDHEVANLRRLCDEILGEENYKGTIVRATGQTTGQDSGGLGSSFDYVLIYTKRPEIELAGLPLDEEDLERYQGEDERGRFELWQFRKTGKNDRRSDRPNMYFAVRNPDGEEVFPVGPTGYESCWRYDPKGYERLVAEDYIVWKKRKKDGGEQWWPYVKTYIGDGTKRPSPLWDDLEGSKKASIDLRAMLGGNVFNNPKPVGLIKRLLQIVPEPNKECLVLDFFAGSGTTAHATLELNSEDGGERRFILVQLPEPLDPAERTQRAAAEWCDAVGKPRTIAEITKERVRRVEQCAASGFRVFKLAESSFVPWNAGVTRNAPALAEQLKLYVDHVRPGRSSEQILYELLLKSGYPLTALVEAAEVAGTTVYRVADGSLIICLERNVTLELVRGVARLRPERVIFLDQGFAGNDQLKVNAVETFKTVKVVSFRTI